MRVRYNNSIYEIIETIVFNDRTYHIIYNGSDVEYLEENMVDTKIEYVLPNSDLTLFGNAGKSLTHLNEQVLISYLVETFKNDIKSGKYSTKEELVEALKNVKEAIMNDEVLKGIIKSNLAFFNEETFKAHLEELFRYFDKLYVDTTSLDLTNASSFEVNDKSYMKFVNQDGDVHVVENLEEKSDFVQEFKDKQNEFTSLQMEDGVKSAEETFSLMKRFENVEKELDGLSDIKKNDLGTEELIALKAVSHPSINTGAANIVGNAEAGIYIDKNADNKVISADVDLVDRTVEVKAVAEQKVVNNKEEVATFDLNDNDVTKEVVSPIGISDDEIDDVMLEGLLVNKKDRLTEEQIAYLTRLREARKKQAETQSKFLIKGGNQKKIGAHPNAKNAAYIDILVMALITEIIAFATLFIIMIMK